MDSTFKDPKVTKVNYGVTKDVSFYSRLSIVGVGNKDRSLYLYSFSFV